jgi:hypothetical protein
MDGNVNQNIVATNGAAGTLIRVRQSDIGFNKASMPLFAGDRRIRPDPPILHGYHRSVALKPCVLRAAACFAAATALSTTLVACGGPGAARTGKPVTAAQCQRAIRPESTGRRDGPAWIITPGALSHLAMAGLPPALLADFNRPSTLLLGAHDRIHRLFPRASMAFYFTNASDLEAALQQHRIPANVRYVLLDLERWPLTPTDEQAQPIRTLRLALAMAQAAGKCVVFTPAVDLLAARHIFGSSRDPAVIGSFDRLIVGPAARLGAIFEVQAQQGEGSPVAEMLTRDAVLDSRSAWPNAAVFVGLSTNPDGRHVTPGDLLRLYRASAAAGATGYWLNIAERSPECPRCGVPQTQVAVAFLETLARTGWAG